MTTHSTAPNLQKGYRKLIFCGTTAWVGLRQRNITSINQQLTHDQRILGHIRLDWKRTSPMRIKYPWCSSWMSSNQLSRVGFAKCLRTQKLTTRYNFTWTKESSMHIQRMILSNSTNGQIQKLSRRGDGHFNIGRQTVATDTWMLPKREGRTLHFRPIFEYFNSLVFSLDWKRQQVKLSVQMDFILCKIHFQFPLVYLDDIVIFPRRQEAHITHMKHTLAQFREGSVTVRLKECVLFSSVTNYLSSVIRPGQLTVSYHTIGALRDLNPLTNMT